MRAVPPVPASRCDARRAITFEREMRGLRPFSERAGASFAGVASVGAGRFLAGVGMPECIPNVSGVLKIPPGRGENVPWGVEGGRGEVTAGLFVISPSVGPGDWYRAWLCGTGAGPLDEGAVEVRCVFASELAVGAKSRDATDRRDPDPTVDLREVTDDPPASFFAPMLPTVSVADSLDECRVPTDDTLAELVRDNLLAAVPT